MKLSNKTKIILLTTLLITLMILIITGYNFFVKKELKISNLEDEIIEVNSTYKKTNPKICYGSVFICKPLKYKETGKVNTKKLGDYEINYKINYQNKE